MSEDRPEMNTERRDDGRNDSTNENRTISEKQRVPMQATKESNAPEEFLKDGFYHRWCADYEKGKLSRYLQAGYSFVTDSEGNRIKKEGRDPVHLMRQPQHFREDDLLAKKKKIVTINRKTQKDNAPDTESAVPEYIPKGNEDGVLSRGEDIRDELGS